MILRVFSVSSLGSCERTVLVFACDLAFMVYVTLDESYPCGFQSSNASGPEGNLKAKKLLKTVSRTDVLL